MSDDAEAPKPPVTRKRDHTDIRQFCWLVASGYTQTESARQAAIRSDVDEPLPEPHLAAQRANKLMKREDVRELIATLKAQVDADMAAKYSISREGVIRDLVDIQRRCMQAEPILDREGNPTGEWKFDSTGAIKATELLGRELGMFVQRNVNVTMNLGDPEKLSDAELISRFNAARLRAGAIDAIGDLADATPAGVAD